MWTATTIGSGADFKAVWGSGPIDVYAVGGAGAISHFNGLAWSQLTSGTGYTLNAIWGSGPADVRVAGDEGAILKGP